MRLLNVGAGRSSTIERRLKRLRRGDRVDRVDVEPADVDHPHMGRIWCCSLEDMSDVESDTCDAVSANFFLEHVPGLQDAAAEIRRERAYETAYAYRSIGEREGVFQAAGFRRTTVARLPIVWRYLDGRGPLHTAAQAYDRAVTQTNARLLMGEVFLAFVRR